MVSRGRLSSPSCSSSSDSLTLMTGLTRFTRVLVGNMSTRPRNGTTRELVDTRVPPIGGPPFSVVGFVSSVAPPPGVLGGGASPPRPPRCCPRAKSGICAGAGCAPLCQRAGGIRTHGLELMRLARTAAPLPRNAPLRPSPASGDRRTGDCAHGRPLCHVRADTQTMLSKPLARSSTLDQRLADGSATVSYVEERWSPVSPWHLPPKMRTCNCHLTNQAQKMHIYTGGPFSLRRGLNCG